MKDAFKMFGGLCVVMVLVFMALQFSGGGEVPIENIEGKAIYYTVQIIHGGSSWETNNPPWQGGSGGTTWQFTDRKNGNTVWVPAADAVITEIKE